MNATERFYFDSRTQEILEHITIPFAIYEGHYSPEQGMYENVLSQTLSRFLTEESQYRGAYYDYLTGLPNMSYFYELAEAGCKKMQEQNIDSAILFFDLTGLKQFNRQHGFEEGNKLISLTEAGTALREDALSVPEEMKSCIGLSMEECVILRNLLDKALVHMGQ